jgi:tRNA (uracil-5-)-methyltransferase
MILIQVDPKQRTEEQMEAFRKKLIAHFQARVLDPSSGWSAAHEGYELRAVQLQLFSGVSNVAPEGQPIELLHGSEGAIHERLMGLDFRVSQNAFFQINVPQTENLYNIAARFAQLPPADAAPEVKAQHVLFDVCCGTGTIGLSLASRVGKIIGLEMSAAAVDDARVNARANHIDNVHYYVGKAEDTIRQALADHVPPPPQGAAAAAAAAASPTVTAIVDPPRMGLHSDVVRLLRRCPRITRLVYVSCNAASMMDNLQRFCQPATKQYTGLPFVPVKAAAVDMFPHTSHCEMVVLLERQLPSPNPQADAKLKGPQTKQFAHQKKQEQASSSAAATAEAIDAAKAEPVVKTDETADGSSAPAAAAP